jgi:hypothetical protein
MSKVKIIPNPYTTADRTLLDKIEAIKKAKELNARTDVSYCKIYKGRTLIETIYK